MSWEMRLEEVARPLLGPTQWGNVPPFPCEEFGIKSAKPCDKVLDGLGSAPYLLRVEMTPLSGEAVIAIASEDLEKFSKMRMEDSTFTDPDLQRAFFKFSALEAAKMVDEKGTYATLSPKVGECERVPEAGMAFDVEMGSVWLRVFLSNELMDEMKAHFAEMKPPKEVLEKLELPVTIEAGGVTLSDEEWNEIHEGDFVIFDRCTYHPDTGKGAFLLLVHGSPMYQVKRKDEGLKILDIADKHEGEELRFTAQVGRHFITYDMLSHVEAGSILEIETHPGQAIDLMCDEKKVARGELMQIGELVGVKILELC